MIVDLIRMVLWVYSLILLARVLLGWLPQLDRSHPIARFLFDVTEPVLKPIRNLLPNMGGFDFSPLIVFLIINVLLQIL